jgi:site-specific DNA-methyltransferase (adenine-specific)
MQMQFLKGDCLEVMKTLPDKSIDCFICDLPYGCLTAPAGVNRLKPNGEIRTNEAGKISNMGCAWDIKIDLSKFWEQIKRLAKNDHTPVLMFCTTKFGAELITSNPSWFRYDIVWSKPNGVGFLMANKQPLRSHEMIYVFAKKGAYYKRVDIEGEFVKSHSKGNKPLVSSNTYNGGNPLPNTPSIDNSTFRCVKSVVEIANKRGKGNHPTQKPAELYEWILKRYCIEGGTMLDPTAGSFTSCFTANKLGYKSIGIEMNETFYNKALNLIVS